MKGYREKGSCDRNLVFTQMTTNPDKMRCVPTLGMLLADYSGIVRAYVDETAACLIHVVCGVGTNMSLLPNL